MFRKSLLATATLLSLVALSGATNAGPRITDKSYWPHEVRAQTQNQASRSNAYESRAQARRAPAAKAERDLWSYQGVPHHR
jgi:Tfp pilus assembly protein PilV